MEKFGVVIVTYKPDLKLLKKNIKSFSMSADYVILVNNSSVLNIDFKKIKNVKLINLGMNKGIAFAQNIGINALSKLGLEYVFLADQDSVFQPNYFMEMLNEWGKIELLDKKISALAPSVFDVNKQGLLPIEIYSMKDVKSIFPDKFEKECINNTLPISSGLLTKISIFKKLGGNENKLFIDWVDIDYDLRLLNGGYSIYTTLNVRINHSLGNIKKKRIFFKTFTIMNHPPVRDYYYFRNGIYLLSKYKQKSIAKYIRRSLIYRIKDIILENDKRQRFRNLLIGIYDSRKMI